LIDKIPEGQKSRVYDAIGYDPNRNAIKYTYHDGKSYIIDDVPEEIVKEIVNSGFLAKTSGGNYMGFYYKGNPSIGAGMHVLISDLQRLRGGKGKEYSYKFEELYSQHRLPKNILKERHEKEQAKKKAKKK
jgi:3-hydroxyacyl-CoA dehydrogenase